MTTMGPAFDREYALLSKIEALTIERDRYREALELGLTLFKDMPTGDFAHVKAMMRITLGSRQDRSCFLHPSAPKPECSACTSDDCPDCVYMVQTYGHGCFMHSSKGSTK